MEVRAPVAPHGRRAMLALLATAGAAWLGRAFRDVGVGSIRTRPRPSRTAPPASGDANPEREDGDAGLAVLGGRLHAASPRTAAALRRHGARTAPSETRDGAARSDVDRTRGELARGDTVRVDGWVLSRSEAARCVRAYDRARRSTRLA